MIQRYYINRERGRSYLCTCKDGDLVLRTDHADAMAAAEARHAATERDSCMWAERAQAAEQKAADVLALYHDLILQVERKFPNETRHETAKRYIAERESSKSDSGANSGAAQSKDAPNAHA